MSRRKRVTMADIANALDVSVVTVSKALAGKDGVSEELRERIREVARAMDYRAPGDHARDNSGVKQAAKLNVGILVADHFFQSSHSFYFDVYQLMVKQLAEQGYYGIVEIVSVDDIEQQLIPQFIELKHIAGLIVLGQFPLPYLQAIAEYKMPSIYVDFNLPQIQEDSIVQDNINGGYLATQYLIDRGHQAIGFVGSVRGTSSIMERYLGYHAALLTAGLELKQEWIIEDRDSRNLFIGFDLPEDLPTAFFCNSDEVAARLLNHFETLGIRVPEDISVISFDRTIYARMSEPELTTVAVNKETMAMFAVVDLLRKIRKNSADWQEARKVVPVVLTEKASVLDLNH